MPVLTELGDEIFNLLGTGAPRGTSDLPPTDFENWLSFLAEDDPWLREDDRLRNRSIFLNVSRLLCDFVSVRETAARRDALLDWLRMLVARWHEDKASIITFNYDTLVEAAFTEVIAVYDTPRARTELRLALSNIPCAAHSNQCARIFAVGYSLLQQIY